MGFSTTAYLARNNHGGMFFVFVFFSLRYFSFLPFIYIRQLKPAEPHHDINTKQYYSRYRRRRQHNIDPTLPYPPSPPLPIRAMYRSLDARLRCSLASLRAWFRLVGGFAAAASLLSRASSDRSSSGNWPSLPSRNR